MIDGHMIHSHFILFIFALNITVILLFLILQQNDMSTVFMFTVDVLFQIYSDLINMKTA